MTRIHYYDLLRSICVCMIVYYHMVVQLILSVIYDVPRISPFYENANMHIATLGVAVFFMLSGASLAYTTPDNGDKKSIKEEITWAITFYKKRLIKLLIPYYISNLGYFAFLFWRNHGFEGIYPCEIPAWRIIFSFMGVDTWLSSLGARTFSLSIGEWFLGCLIIMYGLFPLLRKLMHWNRYLFLGLFTGIYVFMILSRPWDMAIHVNLLVKLFEFVLGMYLGSCCRSFRKPIGCAAVLILLFAILSPYSVPLHYGFKITITALALWIAASFTEPYLCRMYDNPASVWKRIIDTVSSYSYEVFLVHHIVIYKVTPRFANLICQHQKIVFVMFLLEIVLTCILAFILKKLSSPIIRWINHFPMVSDTGKKP